jgi:hypothetical protein
VPAIGHPGVPASAGHGADSGSGGDFTDFGQQARGLALGLTGKGLETAACGSVYGPVAIAGALGLLTDRRTESGGGPPAQAHPGLSPTATIGSALPPPSAYNGLLAGDRGTPSSPGAGGGGSPSAGGSGGNHPTSGVFPGGDTFGPGNNISSNPPKVDPGFGPGGQTGLPGIGDGLGPDGGDLHHPGLPSPPTVPGGTGSGPGYSSSPPAEGPDPQPPGIQSTPEPSSLVLAGIAAVGLLGYTWRRRTAC